MFFYKRSEGAKFLKKEAFCPIKMPNSMTGYGRANLIIDNKDITVEIRSVNHRFFDFNARLPRLYGFLEEKLKSYLQKKINRGKIDLFVSIVNSNDESVSVSLDKPLLNGYIKALEEISDSYDVIDDISVSSLARFSDIFNVKKEQENADVIWENVKEVTDAALNDFLKMRKDEGRRLYDDVKQNLEEISKNVKLVEERSPKTVEEYRARLTAKLKEILEDRNIDEARILTECAIYADKIAVNEETVRLNSHIKSFSQQLEKDEPIGKKLDFVVQEMNREVNTIGSKCNDIEITATVVTMKSLIEQIREQIQNIE